jgi:hypothetical protein
MSHNGKTPLTPQKRGQWKKKRVSSARVIAALKHRARKNGAPR